MSTVSVPPAPAEPITTLETTNIQSIDNESSAPPSDSDTTATEPAHHHHNSNQAWLNWIQQQPFNALEASILLESHWPNHQITPWSQALIQPQAFAAAEPLLLIVNPNKQSLCTDAILKRIHQQLAPLSVSIVYDNFHRQCTPSTYLNQQQQQQRHILEQKFLHQAGVAHLHQRLAATIAHTQILLGKL